MFGWLKKEAPQETAETKSETPWWYALSEGYSTYNTAGGVVACRNLSPQQIVQHYQFIAPLNAAVNKLADAVSSLPIMLLDTTTGTRVEKHPVLTLLKKPNGQYQKTRRSFFRDMTIWRVLQGDSYIVLTGKNSPLEIMVLNALNMQVFVDAKGYIEHYEYQTRNGGREIYRRRAGVDRYFSEDGQRELIHINNFVLDATNLDQGGLSPLGALYYEVNQYIHASQHNIALLKNGGRPSGAFLVDKDVGNLSEDVRQRLKADIDTTFSGSANAGRPLILEGGMTWEEMSISPKDGDFNTIKKDAKQQIYEALGVPLDLGGDGKAVSANNMVNIRREFYQSRVVPLLEDMLEFLTMTMVSRYKDAENLELHVDKEAIDVFTEERAEKRKIIENSNTLTVNEKRKYFGLPPIEGGDMVRDPNGRPIAGADASLLVGAAPIPAQPAASLPTGSTPGDSKPLEPVGTGSY